MKKNTYVIYLLVTSIFLLCFSSVTLIAENLLVTDIKGVVHELNDAYIIYSSGFAPSKEKSGIQVRQGQAEFLLKWSQINKISKFRASEQKGSDGTYTVTAEILLIDGDIISVELVKDHSMGVAYGGKGLLFGTTKLGEIKIKFPDIKELTVINSIELVRAAKLVTSLAKAFETSELRFTFKWGNGETEWKIKLASGIIVTIPFKDIGKITVIGPSEQGENASTVNIKLETIKGKIYEGMSYNGSMITILLPANITTNDISKAFRNDGIYGKEWLPEIKVDGENTYLALYLKQVKSILFSAQ